MAAQHLRRRQYRHWDSAFTSANAVEAGKLSWEAANQSASMADFTETSGLTASSPGGVNKLQSTIMAIGSGDSTVQGLPFGPVDIDCEMGVVTVSGEIDDPFTPTLTAEDFFNSDFKDCVEGSGETIRGMVQMTINSFTGELALGIFDMMATLILTDLQVMTAEDTFVTNGAVTVNVDTTLFPVVTASVTGAALTTDSSGRSETLFDFETTQTIDPGLELSPYTMESSGTLESTALTGADSATRCPLLSRASELLFRVPASCSYIRAKTRACGSQHWTDGAMFGSRSTTMALPELTRPLTQPGPSSPASGPG